ncbi:CotH kinase family protein [Clostridium sp. Marseille-P299]|uniref:CotH kinase family protein n=1 Tax=Clostridium sp. Marseille-P299 TaxID=1805477 RepID=UPI00082D1A5E|nr:CotH kinase family protein [Clostridium sp. Marseille-P299]
MKKEKIVNRIAVLGIVIALIFSLVLVYFPEIFKLEEASINFSYEDELFDKTKIMTVDIQMDEDDWQDMLDNAISEEYYTCDIVVNGVTYKNVGIRPKGNTSLSQVYSDDTTDRYSFKVEFDHYVDNQTCNGLDKLVLNNLMSDATYMKEYISYDIMSYLGVPSSLYAYASISVNGENWGLYLALEGMEESFAERNFGSSYGNLYKPEGSLGMGGNKENFDKADMNFELPNAVDDSTGQAQSETQGNKTDAPSDTSVMTESDNPTGLSTEAGTDIQEKTSDSEKQSETQTEASDSEKESGIQTEASDSEKESGTQGETLDSKNQSENPQTDKENQSTDQFPQGGRFTQNGEFPQNGEFSQKGNGGFGGGMNSSSGGEDLAYVDDEISSYSTIFESSVFDTTDEDYKRVIEALKNLSNGTDLETYIDVDEVLRYIASNVFLANDDSYFGTMLHNYYLYEKNGKLSMLPWDYNLAFGGFQSSDATSLVNRPIDTVVSGTTLEARPMIGKLLEVEEYKEQYHAYLDELISGYFESGQFEKTITEIESLISPYVENDPTAFYTYDEFKTAVSNLKEFCLLRAESIRGQLDGTIPSTEEEQENNEDALIDASSVSIQAMGTQGGGNKGGGNRGDMQGFPGGEQGDVQGFPGGQQGEIQGGPGGQQGNTQGFPGGQQGDMQGIPSGEQDDTQGVADGLKSDTQGVSGNQQSDTQGVTAGQQGNLQENQGEQQSNQQSNEQNEVDGQQNNSQQDQSNQQSDIQGNQSNQQSDTQGNQSNQPGAFGGQQGGMQGKQPGNMQDTKPNNMPGNNSNIEGSGMSNSQDTQQALIVSGGCILVMCICILFAKKFHRRKYHI